ncbi:hypothetical protein MUK42_28625 [Musa troglodytarum]|uniref:Uncharacterized protein n=1 Tax=Musa troglodytarum TaxID=320322 RepID=A0A9E7JYQ5_9LILI|nr:hypothetical protein MUK42_28625 [Musa troglodytarum]
MRLNTIHESTSVNAGFYLVEAKQCFGWDTSLASTTPKEQYVFSGEQANRNFGRIENLSISIDEFMNGNSTRLFPAGKPRQTHLHVWPCLESSLSKSTKQDEASESPDSPSPTLKSKVTPW